MKVVILCGGQGTRLKEETEYRPKPLVSIGGRPILWHIMKTYSYYGHKDFILCLGYKGEMIKDYFLKFEELTNDFTLNLRSKKERIIHHSNSNLEDWNITFVDTGLKAGTGARLAKVKKFIGNDENFFLTYGDGIAKINIDELLAFHKRNGKTATITGVRPPSRFGEIVVRDNKIISFKEKRASADGFINGGFFVFKQAIFDCLPSEEDCMLEDAPMEKLVKQDELVMFPLNDFWHCMDTYRDYLNLNERYNRADAPWKVWE